jgi:hypothetical protein
VEPGDGEGGVTSAVTIASHHIRAAPFAASDVSVVWI